jgi:hypothetical protein
MFDENGMNALSFRYRPLSEDWIASCRLEEGINLNFYCGKTEGWRAAGGESVPGHIELEANRIFPGARDFWLKYISEMMFVFLCDDGIEDQREILDSFYRENILLREWLSEAESRWGLASGWIIDACGRVWESSNGDIDGWHKLSEMYPSEIWPLNELPTPKDL